MEKRWNANDGFSVNIDVKEKKLRLFGFELDPCIQTNVDFGSDGRCQKKFEVAQEIEATKVVKFSNTEREKHDKERKGMADEVDDKKYECRFCYKEFANSQALGGHQNAHKKERQKKKRLELQAKKASINCYLQPYQSHGFNYERSTPSFYDPSYCVPEFTLFEESKGSFKLLDQNPYLNRLLVPKASALPSRVPIIQQNTCKENNPILIKSSSPLPIPKKSIKSLDLQLGLTVCNTSGSDL